jgi:hypothetical protein
MSAASMTMPFSEYQELLAARTRAEQEAAEVRAELAAAKLVDPTGVVTGLNAFARNCLTIAQYAVANLPPELNKGWPYEALLKICEHINILPDYDVNDRDMALDVINFARDCEAHELRRRAAPKPTKLTPEDVEEHKQRLTSDPVSSALIERMGAGHA